MKCEVVQQVRVKGSIYFRCKKRGNPGKEIFVQTRCSILLRGENRSGLIDFYLWAIDIGTSCSRCAGYVYRTYLAKTDSFVF